MMGRGRSLTGCIRPAMLGLVMTMLEVGPAYPETASATIRISVTIGPVAEVIFPEGTALSFAEVPGGGETDSGTTSPSQKLSAEIPFVVRGNAHAVIEIGSLSLVRISDAPGEGPSGQFPIELLPATEADVGDGRRHFGILIEDEDGIAPLSTTPVRLDVREKPYEGLMRVTIDPRQLGPASRGYMGELQVAVSAEL